MSVAQLMRLVPAPSNPSATGDAEQWSQFEEKVGLRFPPEYHDLIQNYGAGRWMDFLWVLSPFAKNTYLNIFNQANRQLDGERTIRTQFPKYVPFALYPEPGGLFPWAITDNGDRLYWQTDGPPQGWPTIVFDSRAAEFDRHSLSCTEFLSRWISGDLAVSVFPTSFDFEHPKFHSAPD